VAKGPTTEHEVEGLLTIPNHLDPVSAIQLPKRLEDQLDLERAILNQKDVGGWRGSEAGVLGGGGQRGSSPYGSMVLLPFDSLLVLPLLVCSSSILLRCSAAPLPSVK
jgi:hypothetical protein